VRELELSSSSYGIFRQLAAFISREAYAISQKLMGKYVLFVISERKLVDICKVLKYKDKDDDMFAKACNR